jgi:molybdopterin-guanine dinucleotide biosynthesis protein A
LLVAGIFVGGKARRMGGVPKGLIPHPNQTGSVIDHVVRQARKVGAAPLLVGSDPAYRCLELDWIEDAVADAGPAAGLLALLRHVDRGIALAIACDLPHVSSLLLEELVQGVRQGATAMVPRRGDKLEPLCAAYRAEVVVDQVASCLERGIRGLHRIARASGATEVMLVGDRARWLDDWDTPEDVRGLR